MPAQASGTRLIISKNYAAREKSSEPKKQSWLVESHLRRTFLWKRFQKVSRLFVPRVCFDFFHADIAKQNDNFFRSRGSRSLISRKRPTRLKRSSHFASENPS